ncbi:hypothetical protein FRAAL4998 [Frankia alni ACN14a]|uniref:Uncharacterized protein n=1 Tax=Frankia alni (strain DSM 45986 / CECT 9034 / ACN14a) TaxID=326424 RepID=Q0RFV1_FRAAA|nr:hypothetical protein FRAAL4998 [Frankia alni ACN14a]
MGLDNRGLQPAEQETRLPGREQANVDEPRERWDNPTPEQAIGGGEGRRRGRPGTAPSSNRVPRSRYRPESLKGARY